MDFREMRTDKILEYLCRIILAGTLVFLIAYWSRIPAQVPEIDSWGGKGMIWFIVIMSWVMYLGITFVEKYPEIWNTGVKITKKNAEKVYRLLKYLIRTSKLIMVAVFCSLAVFSALASPLPAWWTAVYFTLLIGNAVFWLVRIIMARK